MNDPGPGPEQPGPTNSLVDVPGLRVGHAQQIGDGWLSGSTVVLTSPDGAVGGVDVRGGGPGTRETDLLDPRNLVERVHAVVLSGGSAFGLAAADGVMSRLADIGVGFPVGDQGAVVPIVPAAVVYDLGRGGDIAARPDRAFGERAFDAADGGRVVQGCVGAGTGAKVGGLKGGVGSASVVLADGTVVAALVVVNAVGSAVDLRSGDLLGARLLLEGEVPGLRTPDLADLAGALDTLSLAGQPGQPLATTIGVLATSASLTKAQCAKLAGIGQDGLARAVNPVHTMFDGDTVFSLATGDGIGVDVLAFHTVLVTGADCFTRAVVHAVLAATSVETPAALMPCYRDAFPTAFQ